MSSGVRLRPAEQLLVSRARDFLAAGPADVVELIGHICQLPSPPRSVAEHMAMALLAPWEEFARADDGRWRLLAAEAPQTLVPPAVVAPVVVSPTIVSRALAVDRAAPGTVSRPAAGSQPAGLPGDMQRPMQRSEPLAELSYVVVDVETTGGRPYGGDRITEIAAVVVERGAVTRVYETLVNPQRSIPPMITALTNITWDMVKDAPTFRDILPELTGVLRGHVFVAHNAAFDWRFVASEISRATGEQLDGRRLCTVRLARRLLPQLPRRSLDHVARWYGVEIAARHRAAGDAVATAHVLLRLLADARARGCLTWQELDVLLGAAGTAARRRRRRSALPGPIDRDTTA